MSNLTAVRERPLIFSAPMVRALLSGAKTQTRRVVKPQPPYGCRYEINGAGDHALCLAGHGAEMLFVPPTPTSKDHRLRCPYGKPGDRLYVKETHAFVTCDRDDPGAFYGPERGIYSDYSEWFYVYYHADPGFVPHDPPNLRPSIHMPRWASRLTLEIVSVKVERLQDISEADARAEGVEPLESRDHEDRDRPDWSKCLKCGGLRLHNGLGSNLGVIFDIDCTDCDTHAKRFRHLWTSIHGADPVKGWDANPYVWVISFRRVPNA